MLNEEMFDFLCDAGRDDIIHEIQKLINENEKLRAAVQFMPSSPIVDEVWGKH